MLKNLCLAGTAQWDIYHVWLMILRLLAGDKFKPSQDLLQFLCAKELYLHCLLQVGPRRQSGEWIKQATSICHNWAEIYYYRPTVSQIILHCYILAYLIFSLHHGFTNNPWCFKCHKHNSNHSCYLYTASCPILFQGWRWSFFISGMPGIAVGILMILTLKEPERKTASKESAATADTNTTAVNYANQSHCYKLGQILKPFLAPSLIMAVLAGSIRNAGMLVFLSISFSLTCLLVGQSM